MSAAESTRLPEPAELVAAQAFVAASHTRTPLRPLLSWPEELPCSVYVKCENESPIASFKWRGALWTIHQRALGGRTEGVVTASTGNHGQGIAWAGGMLDVPAVIVVPRGTSSVKAHKIRALGGDLRVAGDDLAEAGAEARGIAAREGLYYLEDGEDRGLMAGVGTIAWELAADLPQADVLVVPVGGGNLIAGISLVAKRLNPDVRIVGVQSEAAPAVARSFEAGSIVQAPCGTFAGGLATSYPGMLAFEVIRDLVDEIHLVAEADLRRHVLLSLAERATLIEGAAAAPYVALERLANRWAGKTVALIQTGGNVAPAELRELLEPEH